jgi:hypothetical protein
MGNSFGALGFVRARWTLALPSFTSLALLPAPRDQQSFLIAFVGWGVRVFGDDEMRASDFQKIALKLAGAETGEHMGHADFRIGGKIFATVGYPDDEHGMVKLTPEQQKIFMAREPKVFSPCNGAWGRQGSTFVHLKSASVALAREVIKLAAQNVSQR